MQQHCLTPEQTGQLLLLLPFVIVAATFGAFWLAGAVCELCYRFGPHSSEGPEERALRIADIERKLRRMT